MSLLYSPAQSPPSHILGTIVDCLCEKQYIDLPLIPSYKSLAKQSLLLPLMNVCKQWRSVVSAMFYESALLTYKSKFRWMPENKRIVKLDEVVDIGRQRHLKRLELIIAPSDFKNAATSTALLQNALNRGGPLEGVWEVSLLFVHNDAMRPYFVTRASNAEENADPSCEANTLDGFHANIKKYISLFDRLLPNRVALRVYRTNRFGRDPLESDMAEHIFGVLPELLGLQLRHFLSFNFSMSKQQIGYLDRFALRRITISHHKGSQLHSELIRRNAATLEVLHIRGVTTTSVAKITSRGSKHGTIVYYRLRELNISACTGQRSLVNQPKCDPFPALKTLYCRGTFPFSTPVVLEQGRKHISSLSIEVDSELLNILDEHKVLEEGSFARLKRVSLGWNHRNYRPRGDHANRIFIRALNLSRGAGVVGNTYLRVDNFIESVLPEIKFSESLCLLDLEGTFLTVSEAIQLLCGFKRLRAAGISLIEELADSTVCMPSIEELQGYQARLNNYSSSSLQLLNVRNAGYRNVRRAAEFLVLLTSIVTSITTVLVGSAFIPNSAGLIKKIKFVHQRSIYKTNGHVKAVKFIQREQSYN